MKIKLDNLYDAIGTPNSVILIWCTGIVLSMVIFLCLYLITINIMVGLGVLFTICSLRVLYALVQGK